VQETRQTLSYLRNLFQERGLRPKNKLGQNFLIDINLLDVLVRAAELSRADLALEVGSGTGGMTVRLIEQAGAVLSVEIDDSFAALTEETVAVRFPDLGKAAPLEAAPVLAPDRPLPTPHVRLMHGDVLKNKNELSPHVMQGLRDLLATSKAERIKVVANLPYAVAVPVISNILLLPDLPVERMVVTVQWEIAERLMAPVNTRDYGALAVMVQSLCEVTLLRRLPPTVFWPRPLVESAIVIVRPDTARRAHVIEMVGGVQPFRNFLRDLYAHRRKNLRGALISRQGSELAKSEVDAKLAKLGLDGKTRAECLDLEQHLRLCQAFSVS
jgi:16S rRNA (adenine1518-N6/adenine1519-N6)-dimethyltransferase